VSALPLRRVLLGLRAALFERGEPMLPLQAGAPPRLRRIRGVRVSFGGRGEQLQERAVVVRRGVLGFIEAQGTEAAVFTQRPDPGLEGGE